MPLSLTILRTSSSLSGGDRSLPSSICAARQCCTMVPGTPLGRPGMCAPHIAGDRMALPPNHRARSAQSSTASARRTGPCTASSSSCPRRWSSCRCSRAWSISPPRPPAATPASSICWRAAELVIRAASPVFGEAVGNVRFSVTKGLAGWVARHRRPEFIRDRAMEDPRMKYVPLLQEESLPVDGGGPDPVAGGRDDRRDRAAHPARRTSSARTRRSCSSHIASLVSGAIENAQLYDRERRRVDALTGLSGLAQQVAAAADAGELGEVLVRGTAALLDAEACQLCASSADGDTVRPAGLAPRDPARPGAHQRRRGDAGRPGEPLGARPARRGTGAVAAERPGRRAGDPAGRRRRARRGAVRRLAPRARVRRRGRRDRPRHRPPGRGRDQARRADRGPDQGQHDQGPVRGAGRRGDDVRRRQGRRGAL